MGLAPNPCVDRRVGNGESTCAGGGLVSPADAAHGHLNVGQGAHCALFGPSVNALFPHLFPHLAKDAQKPLRIERDE